MYKAFTGALALALALLVLHWFLPELAQELAEVALKILRLISAVLDALTQNMRAQINHCGLKPAVLTVLVLSLNVVTNG